MRTSAATEILDDIPALLAALPANIGQLAHRIAAVAPGRLALREDERQLTYAELAAAVDAASTRLREAGVRAGDRVMLVNENCAALVVLLLATANLGAWSLVANARLSSAEIDTIQSHAQARLTLYTTGISPDALAHARRCGATAADWIDLGIGQVYVGPLNVDCAPEPTSPDPARQCAALIYTTGTTGQPKGVMLSHRNLLFIAAVSSLLRRVNGDDLVYAVLPISHVYGLASVCLGTLYAGGTLRLAPRFDPARVLRALANEGVTIFQGVPAMHAKLFEQLDAQHRPLDAPRLRFVYSGGSPLDQTLKARGEARYGLPLHNGYGMTESSPTISQTRLDAPCTDCSVGPLIPGIEARLADGDAGIGELWVRGPNVMLGYYRDPAQTRGALSADGWLKTGDMARFDERGNLHIVGRRKELIIRSGFNVYPAEVEQVLNSHPAVLQSAVIGRPVEGNEEVVAFVELKPGALAPANEATLGAWAKQRLAPYKRPTEIRIVERLPAAATGKILKHKLRDLL